jgi:hypothetical protein
MEAFTRPGKQGSAVPQGRTRRQAEAVAAANGMLACMASAQGSFDLGLISWRQMGCEAVTGPNPATSLPRARATVGSGSRECGAASVHRAIAREAREIRDAHEVIAS